MHQHVFLSGFFLPLLLLVGAFPDKPFSSVYNAGLWIFLYSQSLLGSEALEERWGAEGMEVSVTL